MAAINEIVSKSAIKGLIESNKAVTILDDNTLKFIQTIEQLNTALNTGTTSINKISEAEKKQVDVKQKAVDVTKKQDAAVKALDKQRTKGLAAMAKAEAKERDYQKALNMTVKSEDDLIKKNAALVRARRQLDTTNKAGVQQHQRLTKEINKNTIALKQSDNQINRNYRNVGRYSGAMRGFAGQLMGALGITAGVYMLVGAFKGLINTSKDFEKQQATLAGVLDVQVNEMSALTDQAIELGGIYPTMAKEVTELQTSYARLGFSQKEILDLTEDTIIGSFALNAELGDTAELVGAVVKSYDELGATDAGEIIDKLTRSTQKSSLNFEALQTALPKVAGAANALNIPLSETLATLGTAIDATQDASIAGTSYRKILLSNAAASRSLDEGLQIINSSTNKVTTAQELYGDRAAVVALALANQQEATKGLAVEIDNSLGVANRTAIKQMDTLQGSIDGLSSSWERMILNLTTSEGVFSQTIRGMVDLVTEFVDMIDLANKTREELNKIVSDNSIKESLKGDREEVDKLSQSLQLKGVEAAEANKTAINLLLREYIELKQVLDDPGDVQANIDALRQMAANAYNVEKEKADKLKVLLAAEQTEREAIQQKTLMLFLEGQEKEFAAIDAKAAKMVKDGIAEADVARWVIQEKDKIRAEAVAKAQEQADKELAIRVKLAQETAKLEADTLKFIEKLDEEFFDDMDEQADAELAALKNQIAEKQKLRNEEAAQRIADEEFLQEELKAAEQALLIGSADAAFDIYQGSLDRKSQALAEQKAYELSLVEGNAAAEEEVNAKFAKKEAELRTKKAKADKAAAMITVAINAALAIVSAYATPPAPVGLALGLVMGGLAAVQIAAIAAQPIPKFFTGTDNAPGGIISVAEKGGELIEKKSGEMLYAPKQTYLSGMKGAKIYTAEETRKLMAGGAGYDSLDLKQFTESNERVAKALENQPHYTFNTKKRTVTERKGKHRRTYINQKLYGIE